MSESSRRDNAKNVSFEQPVVALLARASWNAYAFAFFGYFYFGRSGRLPHAEVEGNA